MFLVCNSYHFTLYLFTTVLEQNNSKQKLKEEVLKVFTRNNNTPKLKRHKYSFLSRPLTREDKVKAYAYPLMGVEEAVHILQLKQASKEEIQKVNLSVY